MPSRENAHKFTSEDSYVAAEIPSPRIRAGEPIKGLNSNIPSASKLRKYTEQNISTYFKIVDFIVISTAIFFLSFFPTGHDLNDLIGLYFKSVIAGFVGMRCLNFMTRYRMETIRNPFAKPDRQVIAWTGAFVCMSLVAYLLTIPLTRSALKLIAWYFFGLGLFIGLRTFVGLLVANLTKQGRMSPRTIVIGNRVAAERLMTLIAQQPGHQVELCGIFDDAEANYISTGTGNHCRIRDMDGFLEFTRISRIEVLILALPLSEQERIAAILEKVWVLPIEIKLAVQGPHLPFRPRACSYIGSIAMVDLLDSPIRQWDYVTKHVFDMIFGVIGVIVLSPLMLATAVAIKLESRGPILFKQKRHGFNNEIIEVWKFRSMYTDMCDPSALNAVVRDDPRVTRVGQFIRKSSIDELPQLFNVLTGRLSLVGPRPHAIAARTRDIQYSKVVDHYFARHRVKPGITGWAQINGWRGEIDSGKKIEKRIELDLYYIEHWSIWFDIKILFMTPIRLFNIHNAY